MKKHFLLLLLLICSNINAFAKEIKIKGDYLELKKQKLLEIFKDKSAETQYSKQELNLWMLILSDQSDPKECVEKVINYFRKRYTASGIYSPSYYFLKTETEKGLSGIAIYLYFFKGKTEGLYEFTKLSRSHVYGLEHHLKTSHFNNDEGLVKYLIYCICQREQFRKVFYYQEGMLDNSKDEELLLIINKYFGKTKQYNELILDYPFWKYSPFGISFLSENTQKPQPLGNFNNELKTYFLKYIKGTNVEKNFVLKLKNKLGEGRFKAIFSQE